MPGKEQRMVQPFHVYRWGSPSLGFDGENAVGMVVAACVAE